MARHYERHLHGTVHICVVGLYYVGVITIGILNFIYGSVKVASGGNVFDF